MLVLTRRPGQNIILDGGIVIKIVNVDGENVKVAIDAPKSVRVYREEVYRQIQEENKAAVMVTSSTRESLQKFTTGNRHA